MAMLVTTIIANQSVKKTIANQPLSYKPWKPAPICSATSGWPLLVCQSEGSECSLQCKKTAREMQKTDNSRDRKRKAYREWGRVQENLRISVSFRTSRDKQEAIIGTMTTSRSTCLWSEKNTCRVWRFPRNKPSYFEWGTGANTKIKSFFRGIFFKIFAMKILGALKSGNLSNTLKNTMLSFSNNFSNYPALWR